MKRLTTSGEQIVQSDLERTEGDKLAESLKKLFIRIWQERRGDKRINKRGLFYLAVFLSPVTASSFS